MPSAAPDEGNTVLYIEDNAVNVLPMKAMSSQADLAAG